MGSEMCIRDRVIGVVENMSWFVGDDGKHYEIFGSGGGADLAEATGVDLLAQIPILEAMRSGADRGDPVKVAAPGSEAVHAFDDLAARLVATRPRIRMHPELRIG